MSRNSLKLRPFKMTKRTETLKNVEDSGLKVFRNIKIYGEDFETILDYLDSGVKRINFRNCDFECDLE